LKTADSFNSWTEFRVIDMGTIPSEQIINPMNRSDGDMKCVKLRFSGDWNLFNKHSSQFPYFISDVEFGNPSNRSQAVAFGNRITC